ncbi:HigA family addiction module antitoxin [Oceanobacter mangrovi]|uniref:HigA family addiction module antitoxin n=1 Tax=Oceanobacter mangrovi TaxID=2862510 RepID=UPI001C8DE8EC|nr:HigA family addiction module antitoxin [Oceanobacter mangrovi]
MPVTPLTDSKHLTIAIRRATAFPMRKPEHPGLLLQRCYLAPLQLTQSDLARMLGISRRRVNEIVNGQRAITADTALKLAQQFHTSPMFWLEKQQLWELYQALRSRSVRD